MVEGSICEAYLVAETSTFSSFYYPDHVETRRTRIPRNLEVGEGSSCAPLISIFNNTAVSYTHLTLPTNREV